MRTPKKSRSHPRDSLYTPLQPPPVPTHPWMSSGQTKQTHTTGGSQLTRDPTPTTHSWNAGNPSSALTKDQLLSLPCKINNADKGLNFLMSKAFIPSNIHPFLQQLSVALLYVAQVKGILKTAVEAICLVSFLLESEITNQISQVPYTGYYSGHRKLPEKIRAQANPNTGFLYNRMCGAKVDRGASSNLPLISIAQPWYPCWDEFMVAVSDKN